jgi:hypothetical protein
MSALRYEGSNSCNSWTAKGAEVGVVQPEKVTTLNQEFTDIMNKGRIERDKLNRYCIA